MQVRTFEVFRRVEDIQSTISMSRSSSHFYYEPRETSGKSVILLTYQPSSRCWKLCQKSLHSIFLLESVNIKDRGVTFNSKVADTGNFSLAYFAGRQKRSFRKFTNSFHTLNQQLSIMHKKELSVKYSLACSVLLRPAIESLLSTCCHKGGNDLHEMF